MRPSAEVTTDPIFVPKSVNVPARRDLDEEDCRSHGRCAFVSFACNPGSVISLFCNCSSRREGNAARFDIVAGAICSITNLRTSFFFNDTATTEIYTLSLHDALPHQGP